MNAAEDAGQTVRATVDLTESVGLGLILGFPSGIRFTTQTGGTACLQPECEGVYVPLRNAVSLSDHRLLSPETALNSYFTGPKHRGTGATGGLDDDDVSFLEKVLSDARLDTILAIDLGRLQESHEAWIHVLVHREESKYPVFAGLGPYPRPGVLTWTNSD